MPSRPPPHLGLHHVALHVRDMERARAFYVDLLGFAVEWQPDADNLYLTSGLDNLALHRVDAAVWAQRPQALDHIGLVVATAADVATYEQHLRAHAASILMSTRRHRDGATSCTVADPEGTPVQIIHHPPISPHLQARAQAPTI